jgi:hypothetical protein
VVIRGTGVGPFLPNELSGTDERCDRGDRNDLHQEQQKKEQLEDISREKEVTLLERSD